MNLEKAANLIKEFEGFRETPYFCPAGKLTIGYGFTKDVHSNDRMTQEEAGKMLNEELLRLAGRVNELVEVPLSENQINALVSFVFNIGIGNFERSTLLRVLNRGWYDAVHRELMRWVYANGEVLGGLSRRRAAESALFNS